MMNDGRGRAQNAVQEQSYAFALSVIRFCQHLKRRREFELASQLLRSGTSIGANVEEAQAAQSKAEFTAKMSVACKEARESAYWLRLLRDSNIVPPESIGTLIDDAVSLVRLLTSIVKSSQRASGSRPDLR